MIYIITGGPATGKGTRSDILSEALKIPHISTGDILRDVAKENKEIADKLSKGELISDEVITELLHQRIIQQDCKEGFILDGYPRTLAQIQLLNKVLEQLHRKITKVIELTVPDELAFKRILERRKCDKCGRMYGIDFPPVKDNVCDDCGGNLVIRTDDTKETLAQRIKIYRENSKEILKYYQEAGLLMTVDASSHPEAIVEEATRPL